MKKQVGTNIIYAYFNSIYTNKEIFFIIVNFDSSVAIFSYIDNIAYRGAGCTALWSLKLGLRYKVLM